MNQSLGFLRLHGVLYMVLPVFMYATIYFWFLFIYLTCSHAFKILTGNPTEKRPLGRPRRRWEDNIRMYLEEIGINNGRNT